MMKSRTLRSKVSQELKNKNCVFQVDVSTQVDLHDGASSLQRGMTPLYSREDIKEQYCITNRQLDAVEKSSGGIFGCLTSRGPSPCSSGAKTSILSACVRSAPSEENLFDAPYPYPQYPPGQWRRNPPGIIYQPYSTNSRPQPFDYWPSRRPRGLIVDFDEDEWAETVIHRRPKPICTVADPKR